MRINPRTAAYSSLACALAMALTACAGGPAYQAPAFPGAGAGVGPWQGPFLGASALLDTGKAPPAEWWKLYDDAALDAAVRQALAANTDLRVALANLDRARAVYGQARADLLPSTSLSAGASRARAQTSWNGPGQAPVQTNYRGAIDIAYELDLFGRVRSEIDSARADADALAAAYDAAKVVVAAETTRAYVDACAYGQSVLAARSTIDVARRTAGLVALALRAGSASRLDQERSGAALAQAEAALPPLQARQNVALFELAALTGQTPDQAPAAARDCVKAPEIAGLMPVGDGVAMLRRRPDVRQAERLLAADTARVGVAVAELYPRVSFGASAAYLRNDALRGERSWSFGLGPLISWTFPNTALARGRVAQARAQGAASLARFDGAVLTALKEAEQSLSRYQGASAQRDALARARSHAANAFGLAEQRYRAGSIAYLDVLVAQNGLVGAEAALASADQQLGSARVDVFKALGGTWQAPSAKRQPD